MMRMSPPHHPRLRRGGDSLVHDPPRRQAEGLRTGGAPVHASWIGTTRMAPEAAPAGPDAGLSGGDAGRPACPDRSRRPARGVA
jgi:hypothetical protein